MKKYTPGEWINCRGMVSGEYFRIEYKKDKPYYVCGSRNVCRVCEETTVEGSANAALIAAAPDLVEALEAMLEEDDGGMAAEQAKSALKKAGVL